MLLLAVISGAIAGPAVAEESLAEFLGAHGCTLGQSSEAAAQAAGFDADQIATLKATLLDNGSAKREGEWVVLGEEVCTIRLPHIQSEWAVSSPEIQIRAPYVADVYESGDEKIVEEGCFFVDAAAVFNELSYGDVDAGSEQYLTFLAANIISGDIRFYSPSPLRTPRAFQITSGECARAPNIDAIWENHPFIESQFNEYIRHVGAVTPCGEDVSYESNQIATKLQGFDLAAPEGVEQDPVNAWLFFEWQTITMAAGWHEGLSGTSKGTPRPPLCHYPD